MTGRFAEWVRAQDLSKFDCRTPASYYEHDFLVDARVDHEMPDIDCASDLIDYLMSLPTVLDGAYLGAMLAWMRYEAERDAELVARMGELRKQAESG